MSLVILLALIGLSYIVIFVAMAIFRREGLTIRFVVESVGVTALAVIVVVFTPFHIHPVIFLLLLYLITLRVRLLVDLANAFAVRGNYNQAEKIYTFAARLWSDPGSDLIVKVNHAIMLLHNSQLDESIDLFNDTLSQANKGHLGSKYKAAAHYNLGVAYLRKNNPSMAMAEFNAVVESWPASFYARRAQDALERQRNKDAAA